VVRRRAGEVHGRSGYCRRVLWGELWIGNDALWGCAWSRFLEQGHNSRVAAALRCSCVWVCVVSTCGRRAGASSSRLLHGCWRPAQGSAQTWVGCRSQGRSCQRPSQTQAAGGVVQSTQCVFRAAAGVQAALGWVSRRAGVTPECRASQLLARRPNAGCRLL
jgi:hypothetical protein